MEVILIWQTEGPDSRVLHVWSIDVVVHDRLTSTFGVSTTELKSRT